MHTILQRSWYGGSVTEHVKALRVALNKVKSVLISSLKLVQYYKHLKFILKINIHKSQVAILSKPVKNNTIKIFRSAFQLRTKPIKPYLI